VSKDIDLWTYMKGVTLDFSRPGKSTDNAFIESFNGKFGAECLNANWLLSLDEARASARLSTTPQAAALLVASTMRAGGKTTLSVHPTPNSLSMLSEPP
jgi:transposase InsO family protein